MLLFAYLIPLLACLILNVGFHYEGDWRVYLWIFLAGEGFILLLHILFYRKQTHDTEYLGSLVSGVFYEAPWVERRIETVTRRDSRGNYHTSTVVRHIRHPEKYYFDTTRATRISTDSRFFNYVINKWQVRPTTLTWHGSNIQGGVRYGCSAGMPQTDSPLIIDDPRWVSVTEKHRYVNKIKNSNSIFKLQKIDRKEAANLGLYDYPGIESHDAPCILSNEIPIDFQVREKFRRFNGAMAPHSQMRLYILIFNSDKGAGISEMQRAYWEGGNKNEFVICLGMTSDNKVEWARAFSWADNQQLEVDTAEWFLQHPDVDWDSFYSWFVGHAVNWRRKEFSEFNYITVTLPLWQVLTIYITAIIENAGAIAIALYN